MDSSQSESQVDCESTDEPEAVSGEAIFRADAECRRENMAMMEFATIYNTHNVAYKKPDIYLSLHVNSVQANTFRRMRSCLLQEPESNNVFTNKFNKVILERLAWSPAHPRFQ